MKEKAFFSTLLIPGLLAKSFSISSWLSPETGAGCACSPKAAGAISGTPADPVAVPSVPSLPLPASHRPFPAQCGAACSVTSSWTPLVPENLASPSVVCKVQPKSSWLEAVAAFIPERPELSGQRVDWFTDVLSLSPGSQGSKILPKYWCLVLMEPMICQPKAVVSPPLPPAAFYAVNESKIAVISDIKGNKYMPTWTPQQCWTTVLFLLIQWVWKYEVLS